MRASNGYVVLCVVIAGVLGLVRMWRQFFELGGRWWWNPQRFHRSFPFSDRSRRELAVHRECGRRIGGSRRHLGGEYFWRRHNRFHRTLYRADDGHFSDACDGHSQLLRVIPPLPPRPT